MDTISAPMTGCPICAVKPTGGDAIPFKGEIAAPPNRSGAAILHDRITEIARPNLVVWFSDQPIPFIALFVVPFMDLTHGNFARL